MAGKLIDDWYSETEDSFITKDWGKNCGIKNPELVIEHISDSTLPWNRIDWDLLTEVKKWVKTTSGHYQINGYCIRFLYEEEETEYKLRFL